MKVPGKDVSDVMAVLKQLDGVAEASTVYGESDIIAKVAVRDQASLDSLVMERIHEAPGVESTRTYLVIGGMHWTLW